MSNQNDFWALADKYSIEFSFPIWFPFLLPCFGSLDGGRVRSSGPSIHVSGLKARGRLRVHGTGLSNRAEGGRRLDTWSGRARHRVSGSQICTCPFQGDSKPPNLRWYFLPPRALCLALALDHSISRSLSLSHMRACALTYRESEWECYTYITWTLNLNT